MIHNNKVYANADEKFVKGTIIYSNEGTLYHDAEFIKPVLTTEMKDIFFNGAIINEGEECYVTPILYTLSTDGHSVELGGASGRSYSTTAPTEE